MWLKHYVHDMFQKRYRDEMVAQTSPYMRTPVRNRLFLAVEDAVERSAVDPAVPQALVIVKGKRMGKVPT